MKLLEYADFLKDVKIDPKARRVYQQMSEMLKHCLKDDELLELEQEIIADCEAMGAEREENNADFPYAWLIVPCRDIRNLNCDSFWENVIAGLIRFGYAGTLEERKEWHVYSALAACILIVAYAESIRCEKVSRDDTLTLASVMTDLAFIVSDAAFFGSSAPAIEKQRATRKRRQAAKKGASSSFKQRFKENIFKSAWLEILEEGLKRGYKAAFIRKMINDYDFEVMKAKRNNVALNEADSVIDGRTISRWISEMKEEKGKPN